MICPLHIYRQIATISSSDSTNCFFISDASGLIFPENFKLKKKGQCGKQQIPESNGTQEFNLGGQPKCSRVQVKWGNQAECSSYGSVLHLDGKEGGGSELFSGPAEGEEHIPACHFTCPSLRRAPAGMVSHHLLRKIRKKKISSLGSDTVRRM